MRLALVSVLKNLNKMLTSCSVIQTACSIDAMLYRLVMVSHSSSCEAPLIPKAHVVYSGANLTNKWIFESRTSKTELQLPKVYILDWLLRRWTTSDPHTSSSLLHSVLQRKSSRVQHNVLYSIHHLCNSLLAQFLWNSLIPYILKKNHFNSLKHFHNTTFIMSNN